MKVEIYSRKAAEKRLESEFPIREAVISFYDAVNPITGEKGQPMDYSAKTDRVFSIEIPDIDCEVLSDYGLSYAAYFPEASALAEFIYKAYQEGLDILCQCEYGQSRSAACAAAILEHFYHNGISIFGDYRYYPNQMVYHKVLDALKEWKAGDV